MASEHGGRSKTLLDEERWELFYKIVEAYTREAKKLPVPTTVFQGVSIGKWLAHQHERAELGMLTSTHATKISALDILVSQLNPSLSALPFLGELHSQVKGRARISAPTKPSPPSPVKPPPPRPSPPVPTVMPPKRLPPKPVVVTPEASADADTMWVPDELFDVTVPAPESVTETPSVAVPASAPVEVSQPTVSSPSDHSGQSSASGDVSQEEVVSTTTAASTSVEDQLRVRIDAVTEFHEKNGRFPGKAERSLSAGGARLADWLWSLSADHARGKLSDDKLAILKTAPWWGHVEERAAIQRGKLEAKGVAVAAPKSSPKETTEPSVEAKAPPVETPKPKDTREKTHAPYERKRPHTRSPLAEKARTEREVSEAASPVVPAELLPEIGLAEMSLNVESPVTYIVSAERSIDVSTAAKAMDYLRDRHVDAKVVPSPYGTSLLLSVEIPSSLLQADVSRLTDLGYTVTGIRYRLGRG